MDPAEAMDPGGVMPRSAFKKRGFFGSAFRLKVAWISLWAFFAGHVEATAGEAQAAGRVTRRFGIGFLTEPIPDFEFSVSELPGSLLISAPDEEECDGPTFPSGFGEQTDESEIDSYGPWSENLPPSDYVPEPRGGRSLLQIGPEDLVGIIERNLAPGSWDEKRNTISAAGGVLTVRHTPQVLEQIASLLEALKERRERMFSVEVAVVPPGALDGFPPNRGLWISGEEFERIVNRAGAKGRRFTLVAYDGQRTGVHVGGSCTVLFGFTINQTGVLPVANPELKAVPVGFIVTVRPRCVGETEWVLLSLRVVRRSFEGEGAKRSGPYGEYELLNIREGKLATAFLVRKREAVVAGRLEGAAERIVESLVLARVTPYVAHGKKARKKLNNGSSAGGLSLRVYDIEYILRRAGVADTALERLPACPKEIELVIKNTIDPAGWVDSHARLEADDTKLIVYNRPSVHRAVERLLSQWIHRAGSVVVVETWVVRGSASALQKLLALCGPGNTLPEDWRKAALKAGLSLAAAGGVCGLPGKWLQLAGAHFRTYVADYECIAGGVTFQVPTLPDPLMQSAGSGFDLKCLVDPLPGGLIELSVRLVLADTHFGREARIQVPWPVPGPRKMALLPVKIDTPSQEAWVLDRKLAIPRAAPVLLEARVEGERSIAYIARVRFYSGIR